MIRKILGKYAVLFEKAGMSFGAYNTGKEEEKMIAAD